MPDRSRKGPPPAQGVRTRAVHGEKKRQTGPASTPIVHSVTFGFDSLDAMNAEQSKGPAGAFYQRHGHPTLRAVEERLAGLEGAEMGLLFSSGMAAIAAVFLTHLEAGDHVIALHQCYGGTHDLLSWGARRFGWSVSLVDARKPEEWDTAFQPRTRIFHVESPTNPTLMIVDLERAADLAHRHEARLTVDNTFASPFGQRPFRHGADLVLYSATKSIGGHSDLLAGVALGPKKTMEPIWRTRKIFGAVPDPGVAWQIERSLKTLALRVQAANANALELARRLAGHPAVRTVFYPGLAPHPGHDIAKRQMEMGFGPVLAIDLAGGAEAATATMGALGLITHAPSLGSVDSLASLPAHTSHIQLGPEGRARAGIPEGLIRLSIGIEDVEDLWADLQQALARAVPLAAGSPSGGRPGSR
ncbi:MAG TPA: aminotransferase class I/II-fold pyridoxal phosphate-dependent enzyme [Candidatus Eisenbacteria bacterium]|nr:aminotransferase class I/II-fold pyridoxal phosphate-dependent enzyme [Candidatus Eisenbacteria bacterium]